MKFHRQFVILPTRKTTYNTDFSYGNIVFSMFKNFDLKLSVAMTDTRNTIFFIYMNLVFYVIKSSKIFSVLYKLACLFRGNLFYFRIQWIQSQHKVVKLFFCKLSSFFSVSWPA